VGTLPNISCSMIVRDAETTLERVLQSVRPYVDELIICDTGSVDGTFDIAQSYANQLLSFPWVDNFSAARNYALDACTGDWCLWLDADDELVGGVGMHQWLAAAPDDVAMYLLRYETDHSPEGKVRHEFWRERLIRRGAARWVGRAHEVLVPVGADRYERYGGAYVIHHGHNSPNASLSRNIRLLELDLADNPTNTRTMFYLGRDLVTMGELERGREVLEKYLSIAVWPDEAFIAAQLIGYCHRAAGRYKEAYTADLRTMGIKPLWPQGWFALAEDCYYLQAWEWSHHFSEIGQTCPPPDTNLFLATEALESAWMIHETIALYQLGQLPEAAELTAKALRLLPRDPHHLLNAQFFTAKLRELDQEHRQELAGQQVG
jgi:glycosyltransferase involved in cell wall biosynthesis